MQQAGASPFHILYVHPCEQETQLGFALQVARSCSGALFFALAPRSTLSFLPADDVFLCPRS